MAAASSFSRISDGSGQLTLRFFHFSAGQQQALARGTRVRCFGEVRRGPLGLEMVHPEYRRLLGEPPPLEDTLTPIYPLTEGVPQGRLRALIGEALRDAARSGVADLLPAGVALPPGLPPLREALAYLHAPPRGTRLAELAAGRHPAQRRLAFEELLAHHLALKLRKRALQTDPARPLADEAEATRRLLSSLPFALTAAQARALADAEGDLRGSIPMLRLLQGDVGCGKTVVAALAAARAAGSGAQAALMAPTELLAEQHWRNFRDWFGPLGETVALLSGGLPARTRRSALAAIAAGEVRVVVGTHALFQEGIEFAHLALVIVDEQHRFGVQQRLKLAEKASPAGGVAAPAHHDGDAHPAHARHDRLCRSRHLGDRRAAARAHAHPDGGGARAAPRTGRGADRGRLPRRSAGLLGLPADRGVG